MFYELGPFDLVLDVGGNVGAFAEQCWTAWPAATIVSFEPLPELVARNRRRAQGRWMVEPVALSSSAGAATLHECVSVPDASTLERPGSARRRLFGAVDEWRDVDVQLRTLDEYRHLVPVDFDGRRVLLKLDVEGHELEVLRGGPSTLARVDVVVCEVSQCELVVGQVPASVLDAELRHAGLYFVGVAAVLLTPGGSRVAQFDAVWSR